MIDVFTENYSVLTGLGATVDDNFLSILAGETSIKSDEFMNEKISVSMIKNIYSDSGKFSDGIYSKLEKYFILSISTALSESSIDPKDSGTVFVISSAKGNIDNLDSNDPYKIGKGRIKLYEMAEFISGYFKNPNRPVVISNACISGLSAIITARFLIASGQYKNAIVSGGDIVSDFIVSGFSAFKALSPEPCRPFDESRDGLSLGEACATIILTADPLGDHPIMIAGAASSNDANHISGPSRDGSGLNFAIKSAMTEADISADEIDSLSSHGTGTVYNDEMESKAFVLAGLNNVPVFSLKGFFGHTVGAAGIVESVLSIHAMKNNIIMPSGGFKKHGVSGAILISEKTEKRMNNICLKTGSGFGGCNAGVIFKKHV